MDCKLTRDEWVAYHLGATDEATREAIDAHLFTCPACLRVFLSVKHQMQGATAGARPSDATRARIRRDVAAIVQMNGASAAATSTSASATASPSAGRIPRLRAVLERRVPVYQAFMVAAAFVALAIGAPLAGSSLRQASAMREHTEANVDTSRPFAESLSIY